MKHIITVEIDDHAFRVFFQQDNMPRKPWHECTQEENQVIYAASQTMGKLTLGPATVERSAFIDLIDDMEVRLVKKISNSIIVGDYYNMGYIDEDIADNLDNDITNAIQEVFTLMKKAISKPQ